MAATAPSLPGLALVPHMGLGDMLACKGLVSHLCDRVRAGEYDRLYVVCKARYELSLKSLYADLDAPISLLTVHDDMDEATYQATYAWLQSRDMQIVNVGYYVDGTDSWKLLDASWPRALYASCGVDPDLLYARFSLCDSLWRRDAARDMLDAVRRLAGGKPYVLVHDDQGTRELTLPPEVAGAVGRGDLVCVHVDDPRICSRDIFDYLLVLRDAAAVHCLDSCFAWLMDLAAIDVPTTVHVYARGRVSHATDRQPAYFKRLRRPTYLLSTPPR